MTFSRRHFVVASVAGVAGAGVLVESRTRESPMSTPSPSPKSMPHRPRQPVIFLPHGGGPWPFVKLGFASDAEDADLRGYLSGLSATVQVGTPMAPRAIVVVSAHWEAAVPTVTTSAAPPLLFDYSGFPPASYALTWPAPGDPALAADVRALLEGAGFATAQDAVRGYDHGTFVPLKVAFPEARIPVVQLSLVAGLDPAVHLAMGRALAPLRDDGVLVVGSGMTFHNLRSFGAQSAPVAETFDAWLREATTSPPAERDRLLTGWTRAPAARLAHPREEHLMPLMVCAGAAGDDVGHVAWNGTWAGLRFSAHHFGVAPV